MPRFSLAVRHRPHRARDRVPTFDSVLVLPREWALNRWRRWTRESKNVRKGNSNIVVSSVCEFSGGVGEADSGLIGL